jgi:transcription termination/antitermination protein NusG
MSTNNQIEIQQLFGGLNPSEAAERWFVIHTKPRWEKKFADYCYKREINYYLPLQKSIKEYGKRKVVFTKPLFPGYTFVKCTLSDKSILLRSGSVVRFIKVPDEKELLTDLKNIYDTLSYDVPVKPHAYVKEGYTVKINKGPYVGVEGIVLDADNPTEVIIGIHLIQQAVCIQVSPTDIELVSRTKLEL